ncbi:Regulator of Ty1 transposition protein 10 [Apiospora aurea]|uniref:Regulator of Ty1 transposition protein 10 n=1 Tax=Apiospora aurea TaxID=335848 RepID=A0ABR1QR04_9PEZI
MSLCDLNTVSRRHNGHRALQLRREFVLNPVTALAFFTSETDGRRYLLAGEDNHLRVYDAESSRLCGQAPIFKSQSIHGIALSPCPRERRGKRQVLFWGGTSVSVVPHASIEQLVSGDEASPWKSAEVTAPDRVLHGILSPFASGALALLTAHNELVLGQAEYGSETITFGKIVSPSRPMLFSGTLSWESPDCILVASGTVFGEIVVWKHRIQSEQQPELSSEIIFIFSGHEGSIFGVSISHPIAFGDGESLTLLASCSDDRTIRIWDITEVRADRSSQRIQHFQAFSAARETGFGDSIVPAAGEGQSVGRCLAVAMGHASRIWHVEFSFQAMPEPPSDQAVVDVWSFGEDATVQKWALSLHDLQPSVKNLGGSGPTVVDPKQLTRLSHQATYHNHSGKHIWSRALTWDAAHGLLIATGGSDGRISLVRASQVASTRCLYEVPAEETSPPVTGSDIQPPIPASATTPDVTSNPAGQAPEGQKRKKSTVRKVKETFNHFNFVSESCLLAITNSGRLFRGIFKPEISWGEVSVVPEVRESLHSYTVIASSGNTGIALIGTSSGTVYLYRDYAIPVIEPIAQVRGKVEGLFDLSKKTKYAQLSTLPTDTKSSIGVLESPSFLVTAFGSPVAILLAMDSSSTDNAQVTKKELALERGFAVTTAAICNNHIILGSRNGRVSILKSDDKGYRVLECRYQATTKDAITSVSLLSSYKSECAMDILTTSRDGKYRVHRIAIVDEHFHGQLLHETSPPFGPVIESAWFYENIDGSKDLMLCGFRSKNFVVWNETQGREVVTADCGGAHRMFAYTPLSASSEGCRFVFTKTSQLCVFSQSQASHSTLKSGGHGREIRAVASSGRFLATGAEDTNIRLWRYGPGNDLRCITVLEKHTTGIQTLKWHEQSYLFSSGGIEEFFVWRVTPLENNQLDVAVVCEATFTDKSEIGDLRIMDFDIQLLSEDTGANSSFAISMALSDSTLQTYSYSKDNGFRLLARGSYTGACFFQLRHLSFNDSVLEVLTAATDGRVGVWKAPIHSALNGGDVAEFTALAISRIHQSTVKSLDVRKISGAGRPSYLVVTGGDDNAIAFSQLQHDNESDQLVLGKKHIVRPAHGAAITGVAILKNSVNEDQATIVSISNDQRVLKWRVVDWTTARAKIQLIESRHSAIADAGDLEQLSDGKVIVAGVGLEIWDPLT